MYEWLPPDVELSPHTSAADWVVSRLRPWEQSPVSVASYMPDVFERYARILHPAGDRGGESVGLAWLSVAARLNKPFHPEAQFQELVGGDLSRHEILGDVQPLAGSLPITTLRSLVAFLRNWTSADDPCWFAMWDGNGTWWKGSHGPLGGHRSAPEARIDDERDAVLRHAPRVRGVSRDYFLMRGPLSSVVELFHAAGSQSPALWWPQRRSWLVSTEVDAYSSYVGAPADLIMELLRSTDIEAVPARLEAPLDWGI